MFPNRMVKCLVKLSMSHENKATPCFYFMEMYPGHTSANRVIETSSSGDCFLRRPLCPEKGHNLLKKKGQKRENHGEILLSPISKMLPPTQEGTVWDVNCYHGNNQ